MSKEKIAVVTDSTVCLPESLLGDMELTVMPIWLHWDGKQLRDGIDIDAPTFYQRLRRSKTLPTTSQPSAGEFIEFYRKVGEKATTIVSVLVSSMISGTVASAQAARDALPELDIRIVDALSSSMGQGFSVLAALRAVAAGKSADEVVAAAEEMNHKANLLFVVDTLEFLHRGGRIGAARRWLGSALRIKPILHFLDGKITPLSQARTTPRAIAQVMELIQERVGGQQIAEAAVVDIDCPDEADKIAGHVAKRFGLDVVHRTGVSPVVGTHVGPGAIGIAFHT